MHKSTRKDCPVFFPQTQAKFDNLDELSRHSILAFVHNFRLGINYSREFIDYLVDIHRRDAIPIPTLLQDKELAILAANIKLPPARKMEMLRAILRRWRYPVAYHQKNAQQSFLYPVNTQQAPANKSFSTFFQEIYFEKDIKNAAITRRLLAAYPHLPVTEIDSIKTLKKLSPSALPPKQRLIIAAQKGRWLKRCPGTQGHICCNYLVINHIMDCPFNCTYCYLQSYTNNAGITVYANPDAFFKRLEKFLQGNQRVPYRIGTGEFSDSLALDTATGFSLNLITLFARQDQHLLELKTKSDQVEHLLDIDGQEKTIFAWSVNPPLIIHHDEQNTAPLEARLAAAQKCVSAGFKVAFHFDPIIYYEQWENDYQRVVDAIFSAIPGEKIAWISLGALRYLPVLKSIIENNFPASRLTLGELTTGEDGKLRYFESIRIEIFQKMHRFIRRHNRQVYVYLCMESQAVWEKVKLENDSINPFGQYFRFFRSTTSKI